MISRIPLPDGTIPTIAAPNGWFTAVTALTNAGIDAQAIAEEGLDRRNIGHLALTKFIEPTRLYAASWTTSAALAPAAAYANEPLVPIVLGSNVELDWSAAILTVTPKQTLVIKAHVAYGYGENYINKTKAGVFAAFAFSTVLLIDQGAGYARVIGSRRRVKCINGGLHRMTHVCTTVIQPGGGNYAVKKIGVSIGNDVATAYVKGAQIAAYLVNNTQ